MYRIILVLAVLLFAVPPAGAQAPGSQSSAPQAKPAGSTAPSQSGTAAPPSYRIGPQDMLLITVVDEADFSGKFLVDNDGMFSYPYLNRVKAAGLTAADVQAQLVSLLRPAYLRNPQIRVEVDLFRSQSVIVSGEVRQPGKIPMTSASMSLLEALVAAGSPTPQASSEVIVRRKGVDGKEGEEIRVNRRDLELGRNNVTLRDGDIINLPQAERFYMDGYVRNPGYYVLEPSMTVRQAIALAGGLQDRGSDRRISVTRTINGKSTNVDLRLDDKVLPNDTIRIGQRLF
jgi:polysaccharide export outer membrane protein